MDVDSARTYATLKKRFQIGLDNLLLLQDQIITSLFGGMRDAGIEPATPCV